MLGTLAIALREGLEASLIVGILVAYLVRTERRTLLKPLWVGVAGAVLTSLALGALLTFTSANLGSNGAAIFAGISSLLAVALVTWMVFWMKRVARGLRSELHGKLDAAFIAGPWAIAIAAFLSVAREGLETSLFIYANFKTTGAASSATLGLVLGLAIAIALGIGIYRGSIKLNLSKFFTYTGVALIIVAAGVLMGGIHELQEITWLPGDSATALNFSALFAKGTIAEALIKGSLGFAAKTSWLQLGAWAIYLLAIIPAYLAKPARVKTLQNA